MTYKARAPRFQTERLPISLRTLGSFVWVRGHLLNLSATGLQLFTDAQLPPQTDLEMEFVTVNGQGRKTKRRLRARVVWANRHRYGCLFTPTAKTQKRPRS